MLYITFLDTIKSGFTHLTTTGLTDVVYIKYELEDLMELDPQSYPGTSQTGKSVWLCPVPMTIDSDDIVTYSTRIYIAQQVREDAADRFAAFSSCIELVKMLIQWLPDNINGLVYPINITPVLLFDATIDGVYIDLSIRFPITECYI